MALQDEIFKRIKDEITLDPEGRGYAGKTDAEIAALLNAPYTVSETRQVQRPARINQILVGVAFAPNVVAGADLVEAKKPRS